MGGYNSQNRRFNGKLFAWMILTVGGKEDQHAD